MDALNRRLDEIRVLQGKDPLPDPTRIQGFEEGAPPPPAWTPPQASDYEEEDFGSPEVEYPDSPLVDVAVKKVTPERMTARETLASRQIPAGVRADIDLIVVDTEASYKGHTVTLNPDEKSGIARIILSSAQRTLRQHLESLSVPYEKVVPEPLQTPSVKRKRGRPKKAKA